MVMPCLDKGIHSMQLVKGLAHMSQGDFPGAVQNFTSAAGGVGKWYTHTHTHTHIHTHTQHLWLSLLVPQETGMNLTSSLP